jgi:hypothetical protein
VSSNCTKPNAFSEEIQKYEHTRYKLKDKKFRGYSEQVPRRRICFE